MKIVSIFGTRPEIIRLSRIFDLLDSNFNHITVNTNQNYTPELNSIFFEELGIRNPNYNLNIRTGRFGSEVADIIENTEKILLEEKPDVLLILGDTNSGLSAIPAARHGIKIVHLEAGMRAYDFRMPEEKNRILIDHLSSILMPYTQYSRENLIRENIHPSMIYVIGNPIIEVIEHYMPKIEQSNILERMTLVPNEYILVTAHRSENVDNSKSLKKIFQGLTASHSKFNKRIIYPMHPRTASKIHEQYEVPNEIEIINPLGFFDFIKLEKHTFCMITDSGTVPEESLYFKTPCVTIRESSERPEYLEAGSNILAGINPNKLVDSIQQITSLNRDWQWTNSLGDGKTAQKVINILQGVINRHKHMQ